MKTIASTLVILSLIFLGPIGLMIMLIWRRDWLKNKFALVAISGWTLLYCVAVFDNDSSQPKITEENQADRTEVSSTNTTKPQEQSALENEDGSANGDTEIEKGTEEPKEEQISREEPTPKNNSNSTQSQPTTNVKPQASPPDVKPVQPSTQPVVRPTQSTTSPQPSTAQTQLSTSQAPTSTQNNNAGGNSSVQTYAPPTGECKIKGNANSMIYHVPGGQYYDRTKVDPKEGDRLFCTEQEAQAAGFRRAKR